MLALKHIHLTFVIISIVGFLLRSAWLFTNNPNLSKKAVKIAPHIIDTFLLISGLILMVMSKQYPITYPWMTVKIIFIVGYIFFGIKMFKSNGKKVQSIFFALAIASILSIIYFAHFKPLLW